MPVDVHVVTPEREVWSGETTLLIAKGIDGELGIMAGHMPILVQLAVGALKITRSGGDVVVVVDGGFLHVASEGDLTRADVLATNAELAGEIDVDAARRELEALRASGDGEDPQVKLAIERAEARVSLAG